ncbi:MAG: 16S rRNA (cytosine(967)-C(5))-methyltransferase RsmB, partial [Clostridia bacterium]|nr:16S rRNA (cytosine(967)-C(5))-methyltransferase RsmB [Clostridia bacterium]
MSNLSPAREAALKTLYAVSEDGAYLNIAINDIIGRMNLSDRDAALCTEIVLGVERNRLFLDNIITNLSTIKLKKISPWILNIIRMGIYSLRFLEKIPPSATINECVKLAKRYGHAKSSGFVNAILRRSISSGDFLPEEGTVEYLSVFYSYPEWMVRKWMKERDDVVSLLKAGNTAPPTYLRKNLLKGDFEIPEGIEKAPIGKNAYIYKKGGAFHGSQLQREGYFSVQDVASQLAVEALDPKAGIDVLDLCAAPGGKSEYIAEIMGNKGRVLSCDLYPHKTELIDKSCERLGIKIVQTRVNDAEKFNPEFENGFDRVLLDAPCSGLGIIRRKPDIKWSKGAADISALAQTQYRMLRHAMHYVKKGGILVYSTCTISKMENEQTVKTFLRENKNFEALCDDNMPQGYIQLLPDKYNTDGFFIARFIRRD